MKSSDFGAFEVEAFLKYIAQSTSWPTGYLLTGEASPLLLNFPVVERVEFVIGFQEQELRIVFLLRLDVHLELRPVAGHELRQLLYDVRQHLVPRRSWWNRHCNYLFSVLVFRFLVVSPGGKVGNLLAFILANPACRQTQPSLFIKEFMSFLSSRSNQIDYLLKSLAKIELLAADPVAIVGWKPMRQEKWT